MQSYVLGFLFDHEQDQVALIRKNRPEWQAGRLNGIGGKIEEREIPEDAMRREFREEAGLDVGSWTEYAQMKGSDFFVHVYRAFVHKGCFKDLKSTTDEKIFILPVQAVQDCTSQTIISNLKWLVPLALNIENGPRITQVEYP